jgi:hypothetical protein
VVAVPEHLLSWAQDTVSRLASARSLRAFLDCVVVDSAPRPRRWGELRDGWQQELVDALVPAFEAVAGARAEYTGPTSFWLTLPRGHDKTSLIGRLVLWLLRFSRRRLSIYCAAKDEDQAALLLQLASHEAALNPWLDRLALRKFSAEGPGGELTVLSSDAGSSSGLLADVVIVDELTWWKKPELWGVLWSGREKRAGSIFVVLTNAGEKGSWQHEHLSKAQNDAQGWYVYEAPGMVASWMDRAAVERMRKLLPPALARRVLDNKWVDPGELGYVSSDEVAACAALGVSRGLVRRLRGQNGIRYVASIDYGPKRDRTALAVEHTAPDGVVEVDRLDVFQGSPTAPVRIATVEEWIEEVNRDFFYPLLVFDPYQMEQLAQAYEGRQEVVRHESRGGKGNYAMAEALRDLVANTRIAWYPGAGTIYREEGPDTLADEFAGLVVKVMPYGYRFDHTAGRHDDRVVALGQGVLALAQMDPSAPGVAPEPLKDEPAPDSWRKDVPYLEPLRLKTGQAGLYGPDL